MDNVYRKDIGIYNRKLSSNNSLLGKKIGLFEFKNQLASFEVRNKTDRSMAEKIIKNLKI